MGIARNEIVSVGTTSVRIAENINRKLIVIRNSSTGGQVITLNFGRKAAVANQGIILSAGSTYNESANENFEVWNDVITAISDVAGGQISIVER